VDFRTRAQWGATFDPSRVPTFPTPRGLLFIHHNVMQPTGNPNQDMQNTEQVDIARFGTPSYKWAIHPSGVVLEGMTNHWSPDTYMHNDELSIMFMGNFENDYPTPQAMMAGRELVATLKAFGLFAQHGQILGHRDVFQTACPGAHLYPRIHELATPPTSTQPPSNVSRKDNMVLQDPTSGGYWVADETGAVYAYDGAPFLGGANNAKMNSGNKPCVGIARFINSRGEAYALVLDFGSASGGDRFRRYRFPRDGSARV